jgi:hypothetical protein
VPALLNAANAALLIPPPVVTSVRLKMIPACASEHGSNSKHNTDARQPPNIIRFFRMTEHFQKNEMKRSAVRSDQKEKRRVHHDAFCHHATSVN